jgi:hypothetical protein
VLREDERYECDFKTSPGLEIKSVLSNAISNLRDSNSLSTKLALRAFPEAILLLENAIAAFESGNVVIVCVPMTAITVPGVQAVFHAK